MDNNQFRKSNQPKIKMSGIPSAPEFLTKPHPQSDGVPYPTRIEEHVSISMPSNIDYGLYQNVINDRKQAEMSAAEIYAQYLEVVGFNQRLLRTQKIFDRFKKRVRLAYDRALTSREKSSDETSRARRHQEAVEQALSEARMETAALNASNQAHEAAFQQLLKKVGQAEAQMEQANHQFQTLAEEFDNRGILLEEANRQIQTQRLEIEQLNKSIQEWHLRHDKMRDESLRMQAELRDIQMREAGVAALNNELADSVTKAQKQIYTLEDKLQIEAQEMQAKMKIMEEQLERYREQRRVEALLGKAKKVQSGEKVMVIPESKEPRIETETMKTGWNDFYQRWNSIINELTTHSTSITSNKGSNLPPIPQGAEPTPSSRIESSPLIKGELQSESGDIDII